MQRLEFFESKKPVSDVMTLDSVIKNLKQFHIEHAVEKKFIETQIDALQLFKHYILMLKLIDHLPKDEMHEFMTPIEKLAQKITLRINKKLETLNHPLLSNLLFQAALMVTKTLPINEEDTFTLEKLSMLEEKYIVLTSDRYQFDIRGLTAWLNKKNEWINPVNQQMFTNKNIENIYRCATRLGLDLTIDLPFELRNILRKPNHLEEKKRGPKRNAYNCWGLL